MARRIGLYGGSFDPIHLGHLSIAGAVQQKLELDELIFLPSAAPPHKKSNQLTPVHHRAHMVRLAITDYPKFSFSDYDLNRPGPTFTIDTIGHFLQNFEVGTALFWIIGTDSLVELPTWHRIAELIDMCQIVTATRTISQQIDWTTFQPILNNRQIESLKRGLLDTPIVDVAATDIRARLAGNEAVKSQIPQNVLQYVRQHKLYSTPTTSISPEG